MTTEQKAQTAYSYYKSQGFSDNAIYAMLGNAEQESGLDSTSVNSSSGATGIFQWLGNRLTALKNFATGKGKSYTDFQTQLEFSVYEMNNSESVTGDYLKTNAYDSVDNLAAGFEERYERSGGSAVQNRINYANKWASYFSDGNYTNSDSESTNFTIAGTAVKGVTILILILVAVLFLVLMLKNTGVYTTKKTKKGGKK